MDIKSPLTKLNSFEDESSSSSSSTSSALLAGEGKK
eukprot:CAMPEP_0206608522 /NCGR_PEP_ID=MMETSP0325_2-20121206/53084_1 /ASSEMBLY_ACC=CAM_ASM_000347 /TAXON_ID=2866 /ORGANISM="Crypthecodinium cohnii, Strain Seligo" /LENGTH=35 /DNA_ID= /DNA_START= /DNA_END= /DNA_ORIENTATION=